MGKAKNTMGRNKTSNKLILGIMMPILGIILLTQLFLPLGFEIIFIMVEEEEDKNEKKDFVG